MDPDRTLEREDVFTLLGTFPERLSDLLANFDSAGLAYRHGPAFPTLEEILTHLVETAQRIDGALRHIYLDSAEEVDVRAALELPFQQQNAESNEELLSDYARIRRRTVDMLRGLAPEQLDRVVRDSSLGELSLLDICRLVLTHEMGHLTQIRNLVSLVPEPQDLGPLDALAVERVSEDHE